ncbi:MAG: glycoside hydrolase family 99-like domain-containing protein, partial [Phenylobacterium sp.]
DTFQAASARRYAGRAERRPPAWLTRYLARAKAPGRMMLIRSSGVWETGLEESLGSVAGPTVPLADYVRAGPNPSIQPRALFDQSWYLTHAAGLAGSQWAPLAHYLVVGDSHNLSPHPLLDAPAYRGRHGAKMSARGLTALQHFLFEGAAEGANPHPLFDLHYYVGQTEAVAESGENPLMHYLRIGWREGLDPHPLFANSWYLAQNPDVEAAGIAPLLHYVLTGAAEDRDPHPLFDTAWYRKQTRGRLRGTDALSDFLRAGARELRSPSPNFDPAFYLEQAHDAAAARANPLLHYLTVGAFEGLWPAPNFDEPAYFAAHPDAQTSALGALDHWARHRTTRTAKASPAGDRVSAATLFQNLRRSTDPDPGAYDNDAYAALRLPRGPSEGEPDWVRVIAIRRTEAPDWVAVARALPNYLGQLQPRLPADGFADPALPATLARDVALAERYGLGGFCHEVASEEAAAAVLSPPFPFCLAWTGPGDGADAAAAIKPALAAGHAIRIDGRPVVLLPADADLAAWREAVEAPGLFLIQRGGEPRAGFDAHLTEPAAPRTPEGAPGAVINPDFRGLVHDAAAVIRERMAAKLAAKAIPLVVASRDTTPLSQDAPVVWHGASPGAFQAWLEAASDRVRGRTGDRRLVFVHAWNDWQTGAALAPDLRFGHGWMAAVANAADADMLEP